MLLVAIIAVLHIVFRTPVVAGPWSAHKSRDTSYQRYRLFRQNLYDEFGAPHENADLRETDRRFGFKRQRWLKAKLHPIISWI
ncbi:hypothetical protein [Ochrobactrum teleogrylli]